jgi:hypothetical protein
MSYVTLSDLKAYAGISTSGDDALLTTMLAAAQAAVDAYCHQPFEATVDDTRYYDPTQDVRYRTLYLDGPLCAITSITNGDGYQLVAADYVTEPNNMTPFYGITLKVNRPVLWTWTTSVEDAIRVTGKWAYSLTADANIQQATKRLATWYYRGRDNALDLDRAVIVGNATIAPTRIPADVMTLLEPYKRLVL